jgi:hypothetical protein
MRSAVVLACSVLGVKAAFAQVPPDAVDKLRACSALVRTERLECLDRLATRIGPQSPAVPKAASESPLVSDWVVSETTSPLDYSPVAVATATSTDKDDVGMQFSIRCRGGRTELVVGPSRGSTSRPEEYALSYSVNGSTPVVLPLAAATTGPGFAIKADPLRLLSSLPWSGNIAFRVAPANAPAVEGRYALEQLKAVAARLAVPCRWPPVAFKRETDNSNPQRRP